MIVWIVTDVLLFFVLFFVFLIFLLTSGLSLFSFSPQSPFSLPFLCPVWLLCFVVSAGGSALPTQCLQRPPQPCPTQPPGPPRLPSTGCS